MDPKKQFNRKNSENLELAEELVPDGSLGQTSMRHARRHFKIQRQDDKQKNPSDNSKTQKDTP